MRLAASVLVAALVAAPGARADDTGVTASITYGALGVAGALVNVGLTIYDLTHLASGEPPPKVYGALETAWALPQMAVAAYALTRPPPADGAQTLEAVWLVWATALTAHGIWTLARPQGAASRVAIGILPVEQGRTLGALCSATGRF